MQFITKEFLDALRCPATGQRLSLIQADELERINHQITTAELRDGSGSSIKAILVAAAATLDRARIYPIREGIPVLIAERSICLKTPLA